MTGTRESHLTELHTHRRSTHMKPLPTCINLETWGQTGRSPIPSRCE